MSRKDELRAKYPHMTEQDWQLAAVRVYFESLTDAASDRPWRTVSEVAKHVGISEKTIRRAIDRGELPASKVRNRLRIKLEDVEGWLKDNPAPTHEVAEWP